MGIPYAFIRAFQKKEPFLDKEKRLPKQQEIFLRREGNMKGLYLGACLDSARWGSQTTVMYEMIKKRMISFIHNWMNQNNDNFESLWHERKIEDLYKRFNLPHINHEFCPVNKNHKERISDLGGRIRCSHMDKRYLRPSFIEQISSGGTFHFFERDPYNDLPQNESEWSDKDREIIEQYELEEPTAEIIEPCYAILSEKGRILSFETIINRLNLRPETKTVYCPGNEDFAPLSKKKGCTKERLKEMDKEERLRYEDINLCPGHSEPNDKIEFSFDGWDLAFYVRKWWEQIKNPPWFKEYEVSK